MQNKGSMRKPRQVTPVLWTLYSGCVHLPRSDHAPRPLEEGYGAPLEPWGERIREPLPLFWPSWHCFLKPRIPLSFACRFLLAVNTSVRGGAPLGKASAQFAAIPWGMGN